MTSSSNDRTIADNEQDDRFPSGPWEGYFLQPGAKNRNNMELVLTFRDGAFSGEGRDFVGAFAITGHYDCESGRCSWTKQYLGMHAVAYQGYNEGRGIWGVWEVNSAWKGGFHIWPQGQGYGEADMARESVDVPATAGT
ncbi:hypothetical protein [Schlesneria paludicola]|uniref:hypothetical protein n=1 Tax=Schlesneria paludicola TaxID=360056 RepID=UPI00029ADB9F|nr:hypothetical protein [Schlesneria paludicola]